jgi:hypothetical protein
VDWFVKTLIAVVLVLTAPLADAVERFGEIRVSSSVMASPPAWHGYLEHRITLVNDSASRAHDITVRFPDHSYSYGDGLHLERIERTVRLGPGATVQLPILQPPVHLSGNKEGVLYVNGRVRGNFPIPSLGLGQYARAWDRGPCVMVSRKVDMLALEKGILDKKPEKSAGTRRYHHSREDEWKVNLVRAELESGEWSDRWIAYTCYDSIVLGAEELGRMPLDVRNAIMRYVSCGGSLVIAGAEEVPGAVQVSGTIAEGKVADHVYGSGAILNLVQPAGGLSISPEQKREIRALWTRQMNIWTRETSISDWHKKIPLVESSGIPMRRMFIMCVLFAIVIGPVNMVVLARMQRRIWLLWTVPVISFIATAALLLYSLISEGVTPTMRMQSVTILNQPAQEAVSFGVAGFYFPLTPAGGLHYDFDTEVTPLNEYAHGSGGRLHVNWTRDQHWDGDYLLARIPTFFRLRKVESRLERIQTIIKPDGAYALNGLGAPIRYLLMADDKGALYEASDVAPGEQIMIRKTGGKSGGGKDVLRSLGQGMEYPDMYSSLTNAPAQYIRPSSYVALLDKSLFLSQGRSDKADLKESCVVYGIMAPWSPKP